MWLYWIKSLTYLLIWQLSQIKQAIHFPKPKTTGRQIWPPHQAAKGPATPLLSLSVYQSVLYALIVTYKFAENLNTEPTIKHEWSLARAWCTGTSMRKQQVTGAIYRMTRKRNKGWKWPNCPNIQTMVAFKLTLYALNFKGLLVKTGSGGLSRKFVTFRCVIMRFMII